MLRCVPFEGLRVTATPRFNSMHMNFSSWWFIKSPLKDFGRVIRNLLKVDEVGHHGDAQRYCEELC